MKLLTVSLRFVFTDISWLESDTGFPQSTWPNISCSLPISIWLVATSTWHSDNFWHNSDFSDCNLLISSINFPAVDSELSLSPGITEIGILNQLSFIPLSLRPSFKKKISFFNFGLIPHSFWAESIVRWGENGRSPRKKTWPPASLFVVIQLIV